MDFPSTLVYKEEITTCARLPYCLGPWPSSASCSSISCTSITLCCRTAHTCGMEALQMIPPFLKLHIFLTVMFCDPVFALWWPSGLRKPPTVLLITCRVNPEPFLPFYHDRDPDGMRPFTARGPVCPVPSPAGTLIYLPLLRSYPSERTLTSTNTLTATPACATQQHLLLSSSLQ